MTPNLPITPELRAALTPRPPLYCPQVPTAHQHAFLLLPHHEAMFGGAAGPGKSSALLMAALQYVDVPGYSALLLRRTYADLSLPGALMDRLGEWLAPTGATWSDKTKTWTFPSSATITFGYLETEKDKYRYQGAEFQFVGFDELTQFTASQYLYLFSRLRRADGAEVPVRMRAATNPGGVGHAWVKERFISSRHDTRLFMPACLEDNPHVDLLEYELALSRLPPHERRQLRHGDWDSVESGGWFEFDRDALFDEDPYPQDWQRKIRYWDLASTAKRSDNDPDWTVGALVATTRLAPNHFFVLDVERHQLDPAESNARIKAVAEIDGKGVEQWFEQEPGATGKRAIQHLANDTLKGWDVRGYRATGSKEARAKPLVEVALAGRWCVAEDRPAPYIDALDPSLRREHAHDIERYLATLEGFPLAPHDDDVDASSGAFAVLSTGSTGAGARNRAPRAKANVKGSRVW